jgi:hypothetical protein
LATAEVATAIHAVTPAATAVEHAAIAVQATAFIVTPERKG